jgi:thiamine-phosphate diphosphorylase
MRPLPRLLAVTSDEIWGDPEFDQRAAAILAVGPAVGLLVRAPLATAAEHAQFAERGVALARPVEAAILVHARPDLAQAVGADGVQQRRGDLSPADARRVLPKGWIGVSVHGREEAQAAIAEGADFLVAGNVFGTASHPDRPPRGLAWLAELCGLGRPVYGIGGVTAERAPDLRRAGAWGAAAISALWEATEPGAAALAILEAWNETT